MSITTSSAALTRAELNLLQRVADLQATLAAKPAGSPLEATLRTLIRQAQTDVLLSMLARGRLDAATIITTAGVAVGTATLTEQQITGLLAQIDARAATDATQQANWEGHRRFGQMPPGVVGTDSYFESNSANRTPLLSASYQADLALRRTELVVNRLGSGVYDPGTVLAALS